MTLDTSLAPGVDLPLLNSPFRVLGVSSRDNRYRIVEAAEEKSLSLDDEVCSKARSDLTNPRNRLTAEVAWLPGMSPRRAQQLINALVQNSGVIFEVEGLPPLAHANLMASAVLTLDPASGVETWVSHIKVFSMAVDAIAAEEVLADVNEDRKVAGFTEVKSVDLVEETLAERRREYRDCLRKSVDKLPPLELVRLATELAEGATAFGIEHPAHLIDDLVDTYAVGTHSFLNKEADNIRLLIARVGETAPAGVAAMDPLLDRLEKVVRNWYAVAKPIQLVASAKGTRHDLSEEIAGAVRGLGLSLCNEHNLLEGAQRIIRLLQDAFGDIPEVAELAEEDARILEGMARNKAIEDKTKPIQDLCSEVLKDIDGDPYGAADAAETVLNKGKSLVAALAKDGVAREAILDIEDVIALTVTQCAIAQGNAGNKWDHAIGLLERARLLAHDHKLLQRIDANLAIARQNHHLFCNLRTISSAPSLHTINGVGFSLYGNSDYDLPSKTYMATYYFVFFFIPIFPIRRYRVRSTGDGGYQFLGKASLRPFDKWHLAIAVLGTLFLISKIS